MEYLLQLFKGESRTRCVTFPNPLGLEPCPRSESIRITSVRKRAIYRGRAAGERNSSGRGSVWEAVGASNKQSLKFHCRAFVLCHSAADVASNSPARIPSECRLLLVRPTARKPCLCRRHQTQGFAWHSINAFYTGIPHNPNTKRLPRDTRDPVGFVSAD